MEDRRGKRRERRWGTSHLCDRLTKPKYAAPTQMSSGIADEYNIDTKSTMRHSPYLSAGFHALQRNPLSTQRNRTRCATQRHLSERRNGGPSNAMLSCFCVREFLHARCLKPTETPSRRLGASIGAAGTTTRIRTHGQNSHAHTHGLRCPHHVHVRGDELRRAPLLGRSAFAQKDANIEIEFQ